MHARRIGQPRAVTVGQIPERIHDLGALQPFGLDARDRLEIHSLDGLGPGLRDESAADDQRGQRRPHNRSGHGTSSWKAAVSRADLLESRTLAEQMLHHEVVSLSHPKIRVGCLSRLVLLFNIESQPNDARV